MTARKTTETQSSRAYTKRLIIGTLAANFALAFYAQNAELSATMGSISVALNALYMGTGHLDLRSWIASGLLDLRKKGPPNA